MTSDKWKYAKVPIDMIVQAKMNANRMTDEEQTRLTKNIKMSGLSSVITCFRRTDDGKYVIISGHHRYRSCVSLGYKELGVLYADEQDLSSDEILAIQTSHNSLHGTDDKNILKKLFEQIQSIDFKEFAYIDIDEIGSIDISSASFTPEMEEYTVSVVLYRNDMSRLKDLLGLLDEATSKSDLVILADGGNTEDLMLEVMKKVKDKFDIRSSSTAFCKILELAKLAFGNNLDKE